MRVGLSFELRNPEQWFRPWHEHYQANLELIEAADKMGIDIVKIAEHHKFADGYVPQPLTFMAAIAARTSKIRISTGIMIAPLHSPVEIAEQTAMIDCISGGRVELALGVGYRQQEFDLYGIEYKKRLSIFESRVEAVKELWKEGGIMPRPLQESIPLWAGVTGPRGNYIAGRLGMGRMHLPEDNYEEYLRGLEEGGHGRDKAKISGSLHAFLAEDPGTAFEALAPRIEHSRYTYAFYNVEGTDKPAPARLTSDELRALQAGRDTSGGGVTVKILDVEQTIEQVRKVANGRTIDTVYFAATVGGVVDDYAWRSMEIVAKVLKPALEKAFG